MSDKLECQICKNTFASRSSLGYHQRTAKYCLKMRTSTINTESTYGCQLCNKQFASEQILRRHENNYCSKKKDAKFKNILGKVNRTHRKKEVQFEKLIRKLRSESIKKEHKIADLRNKIKGLEEKLKEAEIKLSNREGVVEGMTQGFTKGAEMVKVVPATNNTRTIQTKNKISIHPKLADIPIEKIKPFTLELVREALAEGAYTTPMFKRGVGGLVQFISTLISLEADGITYRNYACTDSSRNKFHRLIESKEWKEDNGAHFINNVLNQIQPEARKIYEDILKEAEKYPTTEEQFEFYREVEKYRPTYLGIMMENSEHRNTLHTNFRNEVRTIASV